MTGRRAGRRPRFQGRPSAGTAGPVKCSVLPGPGRAGGRSQPGLSQRVGRQSGSGRPRKLHVCILIRNFVFLRTTFFGAFVARRKLELKDNGKAAKTISLWTFVPMYYLVGPFFQNFSPRPRPRECNAIYVQSHPPGSM